MTTKDPFAYERDRTAGLMDTDGSCNFERCIITGVETRGDEVGSSVLGLTSFSTQERRRLVRDERRVPVAGGRLLSTGGSSSPGASDTESDDSARDRRITELMEEGKRLKGEVEGLRKALHHSASEGMGAPSGGPNKIVSFKTQIHELQKEKTAMGQKIAKLRGEKRELKQERDDLEAANKELEGGVAKLRAMTPLPSLPSLQGQDAAGRLERERGEWENERVLAAERTARLDAEVAKYKAFYEKELSEKLTNVRKRGEAERANTVLQKERASNIATLHERDKEIWALNVKVDHFEVMNDQVVISAVESVTRRLGF
mmetsp:Transcript_35820/g.90283  ORF Transcript_35820/g.90283 Transcript_35820/m.90283 type:complete len:316 (+) Transcript_35820:1359-2306(+)